MICDTRQHELGPFQRIARNYGLDPGMVARLPRQWPFSQAAVADRLYEAGHAPGPDLLRTARKFWSERPRYLR